MLLLRARAEKPAHDLSSMITPEPTGMAYQGLSQHVNLDSVPDPSDRFILEEIIGEGTYGEVYSALDKATEKKVAIKILENVADNIEEIEEEFLVLRDLSKHPNIPLFHGLFLKRAEPSEEDQLWFVIEVQFLTTKFSVLFFFLICLNIFYYFFFLVCSYVREDR